MISASASRGTDRPGFRARLAAMSQAARHKKWLLLGALALVALFTVAQRNKHKPVLVDTIPVVRLNIVQKVAASTTGEVRALKRATLRAKAEGRVEKVFVRRGDRVKAGVPLALLEMGGARAQCHQAEAVCAAAVHQLSLAEEGAGGAAGAAERHPRLIATGGEARRLGEEADAIAQERSFEVRVAKARVAETAAAYAQARRQLTNGRILAPFSGVVGDLFVSEGDDLTSTTAVAEVVDSTRLFAAGTLDESDINALRVGQTAVLRCDGLGQQAVFGVVSRLDATLHRDSKGVRTLGFEVALHETTVAASGLRPGMSANIDIHVGEAKDALAVPSHLISNRDGRRFVMALTGGVLREVEIEIGRANWEHTEVIQGLSESDAVVASTKSKDLKAGMAAMARGASAS